MSAKNVPAVMSLIPDYWKLKATTVEDIVFFGQVTIREMIRYWRSHAEGLVSQIKDVEKKLELLKGKNAASMNELAKQYEKPEFPQIGQRDDSWGNDLEPLDAASINRKGGATTFNFCGWCKYAGGGSCRYNYHITTSCSIKTDASLSDEERKFNTPCFLTEAPEQMFNALRDGLARKRDMLVTQKQWTDEKIKLLLDYERRADKKPALPDYRPHDWFNVDDSVVCFIGQWPDRILKGDFATAKVIEGYRHHDGCVSVCYDERAHEGEYLDGHGGGYGMSRPEVMHQWEYEYILAHPSFAGLYTRGGVNKDLERYDYQKLQAAFAKEAVRRGREKKSK